MFEWSEKCQQSFEELKALLTEAPPELGKAFVIFSDTSLNVYNDSEIFEIVTTKVARDVERLRMLKDYELVIGFHPGKANVVTDALSRKSLFALQAMNTRLTLFDDGLILAELKAKPLFIQQICEAQKCDNELTDDFLLFRGKICVPRNFELIQKFLHEAHCGCLSVHLGSTKMYNDLKQFNRWSVFQQVKAEHQVPSGLLQSVMIPE
ncbi:integrase [Gossypium australe]|uniref:Integrase n=1 Tax=Gossypium australe TaxID=47621 RepID=A0A5B6VNB9_9ROSI|nr:integrase [Gossypium australe]